MTQPFRSFQFRPAQRLLSAADYKGVFSQADFKVGQKEILLLAKSNGSRQHRLGLAVAKKHVAKAVKRNLIKRLAREHFRQMPSSEAGLDIVVLTRPGAAVANRSTLHQAFHTQFQKLSQRALQARSA